MIRRLLTEERKFSIRHDWNWDSLLSDGYKIAVVMNEFGDTAVSLYNSICIIDMYDRLLRTLKVNSCSAFILYNH